MIDGIYNVVYIVFAEITYFILFADLSSWHYHHQFYGVWFITLAHSCELDNLTQLNFLCGIFSTPPHSWELKKIMCC